MAGPDDAMTAFARELGGLLSTYAQDIVLVVRPVGGARITAVLSDVDADPRGSAVEIRIPDILADETRNVVLSVELPAGTAPDTAPVTAFEVEVAWKALAGGMNVVAERKVIQATVERVVPDRSRCSRIGPSTSSWPRRSWSGRRSRPRSLPATGGTGRPTSGSSSSTSRLSDSRTRGGSQRCT